MLRTFTDVAKVEEPRHPHTLARVAGEGFSDDESDAESRRSSIAGSASHVCCSTSEEKMACA